MSLWGTVGRLTRKKNYLINFLILDLKLCPVGSDQYFVSFPPVLLSKNKVGLSLSYKIVTHLCQNNSLPGDVIDHGHSSDRPSLGCFWLDV